MAEPEAVSAETPTSTSMLDRLPEEVREHFVGVLDAAPEAPSEASPETPVDAPTETAIPTAESTPASMPDAGAPPSEPSRRDRVPLLKKEEEDAARADERTKYEQDLADSRTALDRQNAELAHVVRLRELSAQWNPDPAHTASLDRALKASDWNTVDRYQWVDRNGQQREGFSSEREALDYLNFVDENKGVKAEMYGDSQTRFIAKTESTFAGLAKAIGMDPQQVIGNPNFHEGVTTLFEASRQAGRDEVQPKLDAALAELKVLRSKDGPSSAPETGGAAPHVGSFTPEQIAAMSPDEFIRNKKDIYAQMGNR